MPVYNGEPFLRAGIASILGQTWGDFELLAIDDGSADASWATLKSIGDPRVRCFKQPKNQGPAAARNLGLQEARGRYIAFFDCDDLASSDRLALQVGYLEQHSECGMVNGWVQNMNDQGDPTGTAYGFKGASAQLAATLLFYNCLSTSTFICRRECVAQERFDVTLAVASDYEFWSRLVVSYMGYVVPKVLTWYREHPQNLTHRKRDQATDCLERIMSRQLFRLGIEPTAEEMAVHLRMMQFHHGTAQSAVMLAEEWLLKIDAGNQQHGVYQSNPLRQILYERWYQVCHSAGGVGFWTWRAFNRSALRAYGQPTLKERYELVRLVTRGALKNTLYGKPPSCSSQIA